MVFRQTIPSSLFTARTKSVAQSHLVFARAAPCVFFYSDSWSTRVANWSHRRGLHLQVEFCDRVPWHMVLAYCRKCCISLPALRGSSHAGRTRPTSTFGASAGMGYLPAQCEAALATAHGSGSSWVVTHASLKIESIFNATPAAYLLND